LEPEVSYSITRSATFSITSARYLTSKIAADLRSMHRLYGKPAIASIDDFAEEAALLLRDGYLERVDYGLRRRDAFDGWQWVLRLRYVVTSPGTLQDANPGGIPADADTTNAFWYSYLVKSPAFHRLTPSQQAAVEAALPVPRTGAVETGTSIGRWAGKRSYSRDGTALTRTVFVA
jgi:Bacterial HORMA domain family 1